MRKRTFKYGTFKIYVNGELHMTVRGSYDDVLDLTWPIHYNDPLADIQIVSDID